MGGWPRCPNAACLTALYGTSTESGGSSMSEADLARKLFTFYSLWGNEEKKKSVNVLAKQHVRNAEALNKILRQKYHGTDLSSTASEIARQKMRSLPSQKGRSIFSALFNPAPAEPALNPTISAGFELSPRLMASPAPQGGMQLQLYASPPQSPMSMPLYATPGHAPGFPS